jgi:4-hydroxy-tetrahydrodipicolinate reductase
MIRVGVFGAGGRMGSTVCTAVHEADDMELVAAVDPHHAGIDLDQLGVHGTQVQVASKASALQDAGAEVVVDFTVLDGARGNLRWCAEQGVHAVVGTTGFGEAELEEFGHLFEASTANAVIAPNFAIGAVLMMRFAELAAPYFETAEIIELHHDQKLDAPSGTAARTADLMQGDVPIHSVRLPGLVAHQEVILGDVGQTLTIRHDSINRESFMPGVLLAIRKVGSLERSPVIGLEHLL